jgi:hypothetical protein
MKKDKKPDSCVNIEINVVKHSYVLKLKRIWMRSPSDILTCVQHVEGRVLCGGGGAVHCSSFVLSAHSTFLAGLLHQAESRLIV